MSFKKYILQDVVEHTYKFTNSTETLTLMYTHYIAKIRIWETVWKKDYVNCTKAYLYQEYLNSAVKDPVTWPSPEIQNRKSRSPPFGST